MSEKKNVCEVGKEIFNRYRRGLIESIEDIESQIGREDPDYAEVKKLQFTWTGLFEGLRILEKNNCIDFEAIEKDEQKRQAYNNFEKAFRTLSTNIERINKSAHQYESLKPLAIRVEGFQKEFSKFSRELQQSKTDFDITGKHVIKSIKTIKKSLEELEI